MHPNQLQTKSMIWQHISDVSNLTCIFTSRIPYICEGIQTRDILGRYFSKSSTEWACFHTIKPHFEYYTIIIFQADSGNIYSLSNNLKRLLEVKSSKETPNLVPFHSLWILYSFQFATPKFSILYIFQII